MRVRGGAKQKKGENETFCKKCVCVCVWFLNEHYFGDMPVCMCVKRETE